MKTLAQLRTSVKRRLRDITAGSSASVEVETGNRHSNEAIDDAINTGRQMVTSVIKNSDVWSNQLGVLETVTDVQDYALDTTVRAITSLAMDTDVDGLRTANTVTGVPVSNDTDEQMLIDDPMYEPSLTQPYFRSRNQGIRLIVSADGTVTGSKYFAVEFKGDVLDLVSDGQQSFWTNELDLMSVEWALKILTETTSPQLSSSYAQIFNGMATTINSRR